MAQRTGKNAPGETRFGGATSKEAGGILGLRCRKKSTSGVLWAESTDSSGVTTVTYMWPQPDGSGKWRTATTFPSNYLTDGVVMGTQT